MQLKELNKKEVKLIFKKLKLDKKLKCMKNLIKYYDFIIDNL